VTVSEPRLRHRFTEQARAALTLVPTVFPGVSAQVTLPVSLPFWQMAGIGRWSMEKQWHCAASEK